MHLRPQRRDMEARTALLVALAVAFVLPYATVALLESGTVGFAAFGLLLTFGVVALVVVSDLWDKKTSADGK